MNKREAKKIEAYSTLLFMIACMIIGNAILKYDLKMMMILSCCFSMIIVYRMGYSFAEIIDLINDKLKNTTGLIMVFFGTGLIISTWMCSGTAPILVLTVSKIVSPRLILPLSFLFVSVLSALIGTTFGAMGTLGVVMYSFCIVQGIPAPIAASAVICGSYIADYISPVDGIMNLNAEMNDISVFKLVKKNFLPVVISVVITTIFYYFVGIKYLVLDENSTANIINMLSLEINGSFDYTGIITLVPAIICMALCLLKKPGPVAMFVSGISAIVIGVLFQHFSLQSCLDAAYNGFSSAKMIGELSPTMKILMDRGGIVSMADGTMFLLATMANIALIEKTKVFDLLLNKLLSANDKKMTAFRLNLMVVLFSFVFTAATADSNSASTITASAFKNRYEKVGLHRSNIAKFCCLTVDAAVLYLPWTFCAWYSANVYSVTVLEYIPTAIIFVLIPIVALILSALNIDNEKLVKGE